MNLYRILAAILPLGTLLISVAIGAYGPTPTSYALLASSEFIIFLIFIWVWTDPIRFGLTGAVLMMGGNFAATRLTEIYLYQQTNNADLIGILMVFISLKLWIIYVLHRKLSELTKQ